jgi:hypothetical protein
VAGPGAGFERLGKVAEDESEATVGEEQIRRELGPRRPLLPLLLAAFLRRLFSLFRRRRRGLGWLSRLVGCRAGRGRWVGGGAGGGVWFGGGGRWSGGAVA